ncbi:unnamed protein product, partial [Didymodactylos carnosus]
LLSQKRSKIEEVMQKGYDTLKTHASTQSSLFSSSVSDSDDLSQWDHLSDDMDADLESNFGDGNSDLQQKAARIDLDDDPNCLKHIGTNTGFELYKKNRQKILCLLFQVNGTFLKLNRVDICITEDVLLKQFYIAGNINDIQINEFQRLKFENIKPKLFDIDNNTLNSSTNVKIPVYARIDLPKGSEPPHVQLDIKDR